MINGVLRASISTLYLVKVFYETGLLETKFRKEYPDYKIFNETLYDQI